MTGAASAAGDVPSPLVKGLVVAGAGPEPVLTVANAVTLARTAAAMVLAVVAIPAGSTALLVAAYLTYWIGDMADGAVARGLGQETRLGAVFDIVSDRGCASLCAAGLLGLRPGMAVAIGIFCVQFLVVDTLLSLSFLRWPVLSPNYFGLVDRRVYLANWCPPAKATNTAALVVLVVFCPSPVYPAVLAGLVVAVKVASLVRVLRLPAELPGRAAEPPAAVPA